MDESTDIFLNEQQCLGCSLQKRMKEEDLKKEMEGERWREKEEERNMLQRTAWMALLMHRLTVANGQHNNFRVWP